MRNIETKMDGRHLVLTVDLSADLGPSKSGKTTLVANSGGRVSFADPNGGQFKINLTIDKPRNGV